MKSPLANKILIPLVLVIWVLVIYRVFFQKEDAPQKQNLPTNLAIQTEAPDETEDTIKLSLDYKDPFLGTRISRKSSFLSIPSVQPQAIARERIEPPKTKAEPKPIDWSFVRYKGLVDVRNSSRKAALLMVNGKSRNLSTGTTVDSVRLVSINVDSVLVAFRGELKYIRREGF